jgi:hypothetical protein
VYGSQTEWNCIAAARISLIDVYFIRHTGRVPFTGRGEALYENILTGDVKYPEYMSKPAVSLIQYVVRVTLGIQPISRMG